MGTINVKFLTTTAAKFATLTKENNAFYRVTDGVREDLYIGGQKLNNALDIVDALAALTADDVEYKAAEGADPAVSIKDALDDIYEQLGGSGTVSEMIQEAIEALDSKISNDGAAGSTATTADAATQRKVLTEIIEVNGVLTGGKHIELADVAVTGTAADVALVDSGNNFTATNVETAFVEVAGLIEDAGKAGKVTVETPSSQDYAAVYEFYQGVLTTDDAAAKAAKKFATINVPKDMVISDAEVKTVETADEPYDGASVGDKYIEITIANNDGTKLYIPVNALVDVYAGSNGAEATVTIGLDNSINVTINEVAASKIVYKEADDSDPEHPVAKETVAQALARLDAAADSGVDTKIATAIGALDASVSIEDTENTNPLNITVVEVNGVLTSVTGSIDTGIFDEFGAADDAKAEVIGTASDAATANTIHGAKAYTDDAIDGLATVYDPINSAATVQANLENALTWTEVE